MTTRKKAPTKGIPKNFDTITTTETVVTKTKKSVKYPVLYPLEEDKSQVIRFNVYENRFEFAFSREEDEWNDADWDKVDWSCWLDDNLEPEFFESFTKNMSKLMNMTIAMTKRTK